MTTFECLAYLGPREHTVPLIDVSSFACNLDLNPWSEFKAYDKEAQCLIIWQSRKWQRFERKSRHFKPTICQFWKQWTASRSAKQNFLFGDEKDSILHFSYVCKTFTSSTHKETGQIYLSKCLHVSKIDSYIKLLVRFFPRLADSFQNMSTISSSH